MIEKILAVLDRFLLGLFKNKELTNFLKGSLMILFCYQFFKFTYYRNPYQRMIYRNGYTVSNEQTEQLKAENQLEWVGIIIA